MRYLVVTSCLLLTHVASAADQVRASSAPLFDRVKQTRHEMQKSRSLGSKLELARALADTVSKEIASIQKLKGAALRSQESRAYALLGLDEYLRKLKLESFVLERCPQLHREIEFGYNPKGVPLSAADIPREAQAVSELLSELCAPIAK